MRFLFRPLPRFLPVIFLSIMGCGKNNNDPTWNKVVAYFTNPSITKAQVFDKMSPEATRAIIGHYPVRDSISQIIDFFTRFKDDHNYKVERNFDTVSITFDPQRRIAWGPVVSILDMDTSWKVIEIIFGK